MIAVLSNQMFLKLFTSSEMLYINLYLYKYENVCVCVCVCSHFSLPFRNQLGRGVAASL